MNRKVVGEVVKVIIMAIIGIIIMLKVETDFIKNEENHNITKKEVIAEEVKLDSVRALVKSAEDTLQTIIKEGKESSQKTPSKIR